MNRATAKQAHFSGLAVIPVNGVQLEGMLVIPHRAKGVVLFAHGSGSSRHSPRNNSVADALQEVGYGTLLMNLLTRQEDLAYENRFDIDLLVWRLERATQWLMEQPEAQALDIGYLVPAPARLPH